MVQNHPDSHNRLGRQQREPHQRFFGGFEDKLHSQFSRSDPERRRCLVIEAVEGSGESQAPAPGQWKSGSERRGFRGDFVAELRLPDGHVTPRNETGVGFQNRDPPVAIVVEKLQRPISGEFHVGNDENRVPRTGDVERVEGVHEERAVERPSIQRETHIGSPDFGLPLREFQKRALLQLQPHKLVANRENGDERDQISEGGSVVVGIGEELEAVRDDAEGLLRHVRPLWRVWELRY